MEPKVLSLNLLRARFLWRFPYLERVQEVLDRVHRGHVGPPGPPALAALAATARIAGLSTVGTPAAAARSMMCSTTVAAPARAARNSPLSLAMNAAALRMVAVVDRGDRVNRAEGGCSSVGCGTAHMGCGLAGQHQNAGRGGDPERHA